MAQHRLAPCPCFFPSNIFQFVLDKSKYSALFVRRKCEVGGYNPLILFLDQSSDLDFATHHFCGRWVM